MGKKRAYFSVMEFRNTFLSTVVIHLHRRSEVQKIWENACSTLPTRQKRISTYVIHVHTVCMWLCLHVGHVYTDAYSVVTCTHTCSIIQFCGLHCQNESTFWGSRVCMRAWASAERKCTENPERRRQQCSAIAGASQVVMAASFFPSVFTFICEYKVGIKL